MDDGGTVELTVGGGTMVRRCEDSMAVAVRLAGADTRLRKERRRATECSGAAREGG
jgi:hypothetical protein